MSDPIEKLSSLGDALEGTPMPMSAAAARARGDRIRRRNHAILAAGTAAVVAAVAVPVFAFAIDDSGDADDQIAPQPTISDPVQDPPLTEENLLGNADTVYHEEPGGSDWVATDTFEGDGQSAFHPCARESLGGLGATTVLGRDFELRTPGLEPGDDTGLPYDGNFMTAYVAEFDDPAAAQRAYDDIAAQVTDCEGQIPDIDTYELDGTRPVDLDVDGEAELLSSTYGPVPNDDFGDWGFIMETGLVVAGDRLAVLTSVIVGMDYNFGTTPMERMIPPAARRLVNGGGTAEEAVTTPPASADRPTAIPEGFPLTAGMPEDDGSSEFDLDPPSEDNQAMIAAGELQACGASAVARDAVDRLTTRLSYGSSGQVRELQLFADDQEAVTWVAQLRNLYESCPTEGEAPTVTTTVSDAAVGDESVVVQRASDGIGRGVIHVVRVGNAVVVESVGDEGDGSATGDLAVEARENLADVIAAMQGLGASTPDGSGGTDLSAPAGTTEVPAGFPLDAQVAEPPTGADVVGPDPVENGVFPTTICDDDLAAVAQPFDGSQLGYRETYEGEGNHGRTVRVYPTVQDAVDVMDRLRQQVAGCRRDVPWESTSERVWQDLGSSTGWNAVSFGYTVDGQASGVLYTVLRIGNALLAMQTSGEFSADSLRATLPAHEAVVELIAPEMCVFTADGC